MHDLERIIGRLEEFKKWSEKEFMIIDRRLIMIIKNLEEINKSRWIFFGKIATLNTVLLIVIEALVHKLILGGA